MLYFGILWVCQFHFNQLMERKLEMGVKNGKRNNNYKNL